MGKVDKQERKRERRKEWKVKKREGERKKEKERLTLLIPCYSGTMYQIMCLKCLSTQDAKWQLSKQKLRYSGEQTQGNAHNNTGQHRIPCKCPSNGRDLLPDLRVDQ